MIIHCKCTPIPDGKAVAVGKVEVWAEDAQTDAERMLAQCVGSFIKQGIEGLNLMATALFNPPKEGGAA